MSQWQPGWAGKAGSNGMSPRSFFPGYSAARAEAAAPPSGPEDPALSGVRTAFSLAATPTDPTRPGPARSERAQRKQVGVRPVLSRGL